MSNNVYRITSIVDNDGLPKTGDMNKSFIDKKVMVSHLALGASAIIYLIDEGEYIRTSTVKSYGKNLLDDYGEEKFIRTRNTVYRLQPIGESKGLML